MGISNDPYTIDTETIFAATGLYFPNVRFSAIGDVHSNHSRKILSFLKDTKFTPFVAGNPYISGVFCTPEISQYLPAHIEALVCPDPNWAFFMLLDALAARRHFPKSVIDISAVTKGAHIAERGVVLERNAKLEAFVNIHSGVRIGEGSIIRAGAVLGLDTFQHQRTSKGLVSPRHDGNLLVSSNVEIGANAMISRGFSYRNTIIGPSAKIDAGVYIGHGAQIGSRAIICAGSRVMGHVSIGDDAFIGPGATISSRIHVGERARISIGSVVTRNVDSDEVVTGNFAIPHEDFIRLLKASTRKIENGS
ncbi:DapH/DapD/GlmU-related protein [Sphingobium cupriresistens]|uniref:UDP-3-O-(3-hydroxymyristoyl)glucosamine N-acyltransferase n=1 Tax=Sphingobium cupriresistens TaxID=1132417 RepID=A0A8G1ZEF0_9SPHN|nr:DapH/DapD/GlmU-related protein [Sphingobium cupriresistens]RYM06810.1 hypothetical protein EWH12_19730 [Sphingobium cupriresistens]